MVALGEAHESAASRSSRRAALFVWSVWGAAFATAAFYVLRYGSDVPHLDEWQMVALAAARCPQPAAWLFAANNEHRIPLPRAVYCELMNLTGMDFRSGMFLTVLLFGGISALAIVAASRVRGRSSHADAFFPLVFLHWGHSENFLHSFQIAFTIPVALVVGLASLMVVGTVQSSILLSSLAAVSAVALPFCSVVGLILAPAIAVWLLWSAFEGLRAEGSRRYLTASILLGGAVVCMAATGWMLFDFPRPRKIPSSPGVFADLVVFRDLLLNGLGPAGAPNRALTLPALLGFIAVGAFACVRVLPMQETDSRRIVSLLLLLAAIVALLAGIGHGRSGYGPLQGMTNRYVTVSCLFYFVCFLIALVVDPRIGRFLQFTLLALVVMTAPANYRMGLATGVELSGALGPVIDDARRGASPEMLAHRYRDRLAPWVPPKQLAALLSILRDARAGPYRGGGASSSPDPTDVGRRDAAEPRPARPGP